MPLPWHVEVRIDDREDGSDGPTWYRLPNPGGQDLVTAGEIFSAADFWTLHTIADGTDTIDLGGPGFTLSCYSGEIAEACVPALEGSPAANADASQPPPSD